MLDAMTAAAEIGFDTAKAGRYAGGLYLLFLYVALPLVVAGWFMLGLGVLMLGRAARVAAEAYRRRASRP